MNSENQLQRGVGYAMKTKAKYMRQAYMGTIGDMKNLEQHFAEMAEKGWMIDKIGLCTHRYRAVEPCKKRFFVDFLPQITAFDYPENEDVLEYRRICEDAGWSFIAANRQLHVFCVDDTDDTNENPPPAPIHIDNSIQARMYLKACRKYELPMYLLSLFYLLWFGFNRVSFIGIEVILSNIWLFMIIGTFFFLIGYAWTFGFTIRWYIRTWNSAKNNLPMPAVSRHWFKWRNKTFVASTLALLVCIIIGIVLESIAVGGMLPAVFIAIILTYLLAIGVGLWLRRQIDTKRRTREGNIVLTIVSMIVMFLVLTVGLIWTVMNMSVRFDFVSDSLGNRPALTLADVGVSSQRINYIVVHSSTLIRGSIAVPVDYSHWEASEDGSGSVNTHIYRAISRALARRLYSHFTERFIERFSLRFYFSNISVEDAVWVLSSEDAAFWGAEKGIAFDDIHSDAIDMILLNGSTILRIYANGENMDLDTVRLAVRNLWN